MTENRQAHRRQADCLPCPYAESIESIKQEMHGLREFVERKMEDVPDRLIKLEFSAGKHNSLIHDCDVDRGEAMKKVHAMETKLEVLEEKLKPLGEARLWVIALGAMMIANLLQGMLK